MTWHKTTIKITVLIMLIVRWKKNELANPVRTEGTMVV